MELLDVKGKVETAFRRVLEPYTESGGELSAFQLVYRFFTGSLHARRLSVVAGDHEITLRAENGTPLLWSQAVTVELVTNKKDDTTAHDDYVGKVADVIYGGADFLTLLNDAMQGEGFLAWHWESDASRECEVDGTVLKTRMGGTLHMQPWGGQS